MTDTDRAIAAWIGVLAVVLAVLLVGPGVWW